MSPDPDNAPVGVRPRTVVVATLVLNTSLTLAAFIVFFSSGSQLILAQGADSLVDLAAGTILLISVAVGHQPRDRNHPFGHQRAEPIGALITAVLAGVLAFEVVRSAFTALLTENAASMGTPVLALLGAKFAIKGGVLLVIKMRASGSRSAALNAVRIDTRNDVVATASSLMGYALARSGMPWADATLALPVGLYIAYNGIQLARENLRYLMGEAPAQVVLDELRDSAAQVAGVLEVRRLRAQYAGVDLHVEVAIVVDGTSSVVEGHDISVEVQRKIESHPLVGEAFVHVDTAG